MCLPWPVPSWYCRPHQCRDLTLLSVPAASVTRRATRVPGPRRRSTQVAPPSALTWRSSPAPPRAGERPADCLRRHTGDEVGVRCARIAALSAVTVGNLARRPTLIVVEIAVHSKARWYYWLHPSDGRRKWSAPVFKTMAIDGPVSAPPSDTRLRANRWLLHRWTPLTTVIGFGGAS